MVGDILQPTHLLLILVVALLVLGPKRLPEVGRTLGSGLRDFRSAINGESSSHHAERPGPEFVGAASEPPDPADAEAEPVVEPAATDTATPPPLQFARDESSRSAETRSGA